MTQTVKLTILDEVWVVVHGLASNHHDYLYNKYAVPAPNYFFNPAFKLGRWDGKIRFYQKTGKTYLYLIEELVTKIIGWGYKISVEDKRRTVPVDVPPIDTTLFSKFNHLTTGQPIVLRQLQVDAVNAATVHGNGTIIAGTGAGKTLATAALCTVYGNFGIRTLTIVPSTTLIGATKREYINVGLDTGEYSGDEKTPERQHVVSTWQAVQHNPKIVSMFQMVIVDECLAANTNILLADGTTKPISQVDPGDIVVTYNEQTLVYEHNKVAKRHENLSISSSEKMYLLTFDNDTKLEVTGNHKIMTSMGYVRADELSVDHEIISFDAETHKHISRIEIPKPETTYNLHIENNHNYVANGIVVSNCHGLKGKVLTQIITEQASSIMYRFGVTGTLPKDPADAMAVVAAVGPVRVEIPAHELIADGTLADLHISIMQLDEDLTHQYEEYLEMERQTLAGIMSKPPSYKQFKDGYFGDFASEKAYLQRKEDRLQWIADMIMVKRETSKGNVMCLVDSIPFGRKLRDMIPNAIFVNGKDVKTTNDKQRIYDMFNDFDDLVVIATVHIAGVGVSIDRIFHLFLIDIGKSFVRVIQAIGRGLRKSHDKDFVGVVDVCSDLKYSKKHLAARINFYKEARYPHKKHLIKYMEMC